MPRPLPLPLTRPLLLALSLLLPACLERKESITLNPDGSGKAVIDTLFTLPPVPGVKPDASIMGKQMATQMIPGARRRCLERPHYRCRPRRPRPRLGHRLLPRHLKVPARHSVGYHLEQRRRRQLHPRYQKR